MYDYILPLPFCFSTEEDIAPSDICREVWKKKLLDWKEYVEQRMLKYPESQGRWNLSAGKKDLLSV